MREKNDREKDYMFTKGGGFFSRSCAIPGHRHKPL